MKRRSSSYSKKSSKETTKMQISPCSLKRSARKLRRREKRRLQELRGLKKVQLALEDSQGRRRRVFLMRRTSSLDMRN